MEFKDKLKALRTTAGLTRKELSKTMGVPYKTLESWETGSRIPPAYVQHSVLIFIEKTQKNI